MWGEMHQNNTKHIHKAFAWDEFLHKAVEMRVLQAGDFI